MVEAGRKNGLPVWYLMAKDGGHDLAKKQNIDFQFYATILLIKEYLLKQQNDLRENAVRKNILLFALLVIVSANISAQTEEKRIERLSGLARIWGAVKYFHPFPAYREIDWTRH